MKYTKEQYTQSLEILHKLVKPGDKVFTILRHVSRSGMQRQIDLVIIDKEDQTPRYLSYHAAVVLGMKRTDSGIHINGCGMDMGFELVYRLGQTLWPNGTPKPHGTRNGSPDTHGGYALKHFWL